ncbi:MAG: TIGR00180 family glycosyltransferase [Propionivibrio sp.]
MSIITIVIPTHNRPNYLWRCVNYLSERAVEWPVMVVNSSDEECFRANELNINSVANGNFMHLDCRGMSIQEKYEYALDSITTRYLVLCGDDDFLVLPRVKECLGLLESDPDCSHAHGRIIVFWESGRFNNPIQRIREYVQSPNEGDLYERLAHHLRDYRNNFYAVHRTEDFKRAFRLTVKVSVSAELQERILAFEAVISGGRKMVDGVLMFRQKGITGVERKG